MRSKIQFVIVFLVVLFVFCVETVEACSCALQETCQSFAYSKVVFTGKVIDSTETVRTKKRTVQPIGGESEEEEFTEKRQISRVLVEESFAGTQAGQEILIETEISSSCRFSLPKGVSLLIYANQDAGEENLMTHFCSGTKLVSAAEVDLAYLKANKNVRANVSGKIGFGDWWKLDPTLLAKYGVTTVALVNQEKQFQVNIAEDGTYKFTDVPPGKYKINAVLPDFLTIDDPNESDDDDETEIEVSDYGCFKKDFRLLENGRVGGKITDGEGKPVAEVTVYLIPVSKTGQKIKQEEACYDTGLCSDTDENGNYFFKGLKSGYYLVGVRLGNYVGNNSADAAFLKTYYPGTALEKSATAVRIKFGKQTEDIDFKLTRVFPKREIKGRVFFEDGRPASKVRVRYVARTPDLKDSGITFIKTDEDGYFSFTGYENHSYLIGAFTDSRDGNKSLDALAMVVDVLPQKAPKEIKLILDQDGEEACPKCGDYSNFPKTKPRKK